MTDQSNASLSSIPVLTEIVPLPSQKFPTVSSQVSPTALNLDSFIGPLRLSLLEDIQSRLEPVLQKRLLEALQPTLADLSLHIRQIIEDEVNILIDEALEKEKNRLYALQQKDSQNP